MHADDDDDDGMFTEETNVRNVHEERLASRGRPVTVAAVMMQRDEKRLLDPWLRYHAMLFGAENLHVIDAGSTEPSVLRRLEEAEEAGVKVIRDHRSPGAMQRRGEIVTQVMRGLEQDGVDFLMPLDCAEFVAHMAPTGKIDCAPDPILTYLNTSCRDDARVLMIRGAYMNVPGFRGFYFFKNARRVFFARGSVGSVENGFHAGTSRRSEEVNRVPLIQFQLRFPPFDQLLSSHRQAMDQSNAAYAAEGFRNFKGPLADDGFQKMEEAEYLSFFRRFDRLPLSPLRVALKGVGADLPW